MSSHHKTNFKIINCLKVMLNLNEGTYGPYHKPGDCTQDTHFNLIILILQIPNTINSTYQQSPSIKQILQNFSTFLQKEIIRKRL